ncbi:MAG: acetyl/propionyl/methylcrotonyl-CoA carboxylase subunit alpha [Parvularculaceae bacterium]
MFEKILIANRGEIACRVIRTARRLGVKTVAVYSDADAQSPHVAQADEAVLIGPAAPAQSYLRADRILEAAQRTGAQAVHPGYGFLSENAEFSEACAAAGIVFIGPKAETIRAMGSKSEAKRLMKEAGVPVAPGYEGEDQSVDVFMREAERIGYPVLLKAAAGGGGKGMRLVEKPTELAEALASARREAKSAFGDDRFLVEKYIGRPRHVEVQIFGDSCGNIVHLYERDCSVQRRHQKVIEEAPAPRLPEHVRAHLHEAAIQAAKTVDYLGAGTVEFLYDGADAVYFMEMNTRLQVEHPVTEFVTDLDLVEWQLRIAAGDEIPLEQHEIDCLGHAVECRLYAEDADNGFAPSVGTLERLSLPEDEARVDCGVAEGGEVSPNYDPMIAKIITYGQDREEALSLMRRALEKTRVSGLATNARFLHALCADPDFIAAEIDTHFIERRREQLFRERAIDDRVLAAAALHLRENAVTSFQAQPEDPHSPWAQLAGWRMNRPARSIHWLETEDALIRIRIEMVGRNGYRILVGEDERVIEVARAAPQGSGLRITLAGDSFDADFARHRGGLRVWIGAESWDLREGAPGRVAAAGGASEGSLAAPLPGVITGLAVEPGADVEAGQTLLVMEAMKMEYAVKAPAAGVVKAFLFAEGDTVNEGDLLVEFEAT